jgi:adenylate cyclase
MKFIRRLKQGFTVIRRYRWRWVMIIAVSWTLIDLMLWGARAAVPQPAAFEDASDPRSLSYAMLRIGVVFVMSGVMGYLLVFKFRLLFRNKSLWANFVLKTLILMACSFFMNFFNLFGYFYLIQGRGFWASLAFYFKLPAEKFWLVHGLPLWLLIFLITQLFIEMSEKYSPGIFTDILSGKYINPQNETRIVVFLDLKDSTPIAELLGHKQYFLFIRDFIQHVSLALLEHDARIYQYVGDEIVVSWTANKANTDKCIHALLDARKVLQKKSEDFRRKFSISPEFRVGIHIGEVTVGEIGLIKKDIAMSGDTMNTAARIRTACRELNQKWIASKDFIDQTGLESWQSESLGSIELKGKGEGIELYGLKI